jgi:hypothetical protein
MREPMSGDLLELQLELRHKQPGHFADSASMWVVTGTYPEGSKYGPGGFRDCIARVVPGFVTGTDAPIFEILLYGDEKHLVTAVDITAAYELLLVKASDPLSAYYECDQALINAALERRDETR